MFIDKEALDMETSDIIQIALIVVILALLAFVVIRGMRNENVEEVEEMVTISNPVGTRIVSITAVSESPEQAQKIANELAHLAIAQLSEIMASSPPRLAEEAVVPIEKAGPSYLLSILLGALALSAAYCGVEAVRFVGRDAICSGEEFERCFGIAPLACVPDGNVVDRSDPAYRKKGRGAREA